jgi:hypothetical protein
VQNLHIPLWALDKKSNVQKMHIAIQETNGARCNLCKNCTSSYRREKEGKGDGKLDKSKKLNLS